MKSPILTFFFLLLKYASKFWPSLSIGPNFLRPRCVFLRIFIFLRQSFVSYFARWWQSLGFLPDTKQLSKRSKNIKAFAPIVFTIICRFRCEWYYCCLILRVKKKYKRRTGIEGYKPRADWSIIIIFFEDYHMRNCGFLITPNRICAIINNKHDKILICSASL